MECGSMYNGRVPGEELPFEKMVVEGVGLDTTVCVEFDKWWWLALPVGLLALGVLLLVVVVLDGYLDVGTLTISTTQSFGGLCHTAWSRGTLPAAREFGLWGHPERCGGAAEGSGLSLKGYYWGWVTPRTPQNHTEFGIRLL